MKKQTIIKTTLILFVLGIFSLFLTNFVIADEEGITPTPETTADEENVKAIREEVQKKVKGILEEKEQGKKRGFGGEITDIGDLTLTLETNEGEKEIKVATDAAIFGQSGKKIKFEDLKKNLFVIAMGYINEEAKLETTRLVVDEKPKPTGKQAIVGKITDISSEEKVITIKNERKEIIYTVEITSKTRLTRKTKEGKASKAKFTDFEKNDRLVVIGEPTENEHKIITASVILAIAEREEEKTSTPSSFTTE